MIVRQAGTALSQPQALEHTFLDRARMKQPDGMNAPLLAESIDAADALLEAQRIPRQLQIDDEPAAVMQVQSFTRGVGGDQHVEIAAIERLNDVPPQLRRRSAADRSGANAGGSAASTASTVSRYSVKTIAGSCDARERA